MYQASLIPNEIRAHFKNPKDLLWRVQTCFLPPENLSITPLEYAERYIKIKDINELIIRFKINSVQKNYLKIKNALPRPKATGHRVIVLKARRMGITTLEQSISYSICRTRRHSKCLTVAQTKDDASAIFEMVRRMHDEDPNYAKLDKDRSDAIAYKILKSEFKIASADSVAFGRGDQFYKSHGSEVAYWDATDRRLTNLIAAICEATQQGEVVLESTANGVTNLYHDMWQEAYAGKGIWAPIFLGWYLDARNQVLCTDEEREELIETANEEEWDLVRSFSCTANQLLWRRERLKGGVDIFKQEFPSTPQEAFISSGSSYFSIGSIDRLSLKCAEPLADDGSGFRIWKYPMPGRKYCIGVDTSEGQETSDDTPIAVLDWESGEQVAEYNGKLDPYVLGYKAVEIARMYNNALLAVEMNNTGHSVLNTIINQCMYGNIYYHEDPLREDRRESKVPGWRTTGGTRPIMLQELKQALDQNSMIVNSKLFLSQCRVFRDSGMGKSEASRSSGHHGDLVIAWAIAWQARKSRWMLTLEPVFA